MIPGILVAKLLGVATTAGVMATNAWLLAALAVVLYTWCRIAGCDYAASAVTALVGALGAGLLPFASTGYAEVGLATAIATGMLGVAATSGRRAWGPLVTGAAAGAAVLMRDDSALLVLPWLALGCWLSADARRHAVSRFVIGALPSAALWCVYNQARFGAPWRIGRGGVAVYNHPFLKGLYGYLVSPGRGLIFYVPVIAVAAMGIARAWRRDRVVVATGAALLLSRIVFFAPYWGWYGGGGGFGPRYVLPAMPVLAVGIMEVARAPRSIVPPLRIVAPFLVAVSVVVGFAGAAVDPARQSLLAAIQSDSRVRLDTSSREAFLGRLEAPATTAVIDRYMFDWRLFPITDALASLVRGDDLAARALHRPVSRARLLIVFVAVVAGLGLLAAGSRVSGPRRALNDDGEPTGGEP
jgi:hypothetical protein